MAKQIPEHLSEAIGRYLDGNATPEDKKQISLWYRSFDDSKVEVDSDQSSTIDEADIKLRMRLSEIIGHVSEQRIISPRRSLLPRIAAAAAIIFILSSSAWFFIFKKQKESNLAATIKKHQAIIANIDQKVVLTLEDGSKVSLTDARAGEIVRQEGLIITKTAEGELVYSLASSGADRARSSGFNLIETPKGVQYNLRLPDGTKILLNAQSKFRFPSDFKATEFVTDLEGEGYFEVAHNKTRKFKVRSGHQLVEVLGTRFNINAYQQEPAIITTLLEGSILITDLNTSISTHIKPGQQARLSKMLILSDVNAPDAKAWAEGYFHFNDADLKTVMHQLERWYGISVKYEGRVKLQQFSGVIDKTLTFEQVLEILEKNDVHFKVNGKNVTVTP